MTTTSHSGSAEGFMYSKFKELTKGYFYTTRWIRDKKGKYKFREETSIWIDMYQPRECSYERWNKDKKQNDTIPLVPSITDISTPPPVEYRGITLYQLLAVAANIKRRCVTENWTNIDGVSLTPETVTLYDCNKYVILPFTESAKQSFVSCLPSTAGPQPPRWFASHWWGEPVFDFIRCLEQHIRDFGRNGYRHNGADNDDDERGGGMTMDTPIWICAYSNNQHHLGDDITDDPKESGFTRAMEVAEGRTITILDKDGLVFTRVWCAYELFLTLANDHADKEDGTKKSKGTWVIYTAHPHKYANMYSNKTMDKESVGIISGGAPTDAGFAEYTAVRERYFPFKLIEQSLTVKVETAKASKEEDRIHILNTIRGNGGDGINDPPPASDRKYDDVNDALRAGFISTVPSLRAASAENSDTWDAFLVAMSKGKKDLRMTFDFDEDGWDGLTADKATQLIHHLPLTTLQLDIHNANFGVGFFDAVIKHICESSRLENLYLWKTFFGEEGEKEETTVRFIGAIATNGSLTTLNLVSMDVLLGLNNLEQWGSALITNKTLTKLVLYGVKDGDEIRCKLKEMTKHRIPALDIE